MRSHFPLAKRMWLRGGFARRIRRHPLLSAAITHRRVLASARSFSVSPSIISKQPSIVVHSTHAELLDSIFSIKILIDWERINSRLLELDSQVMGTGNTYNASTAALMKEHAALNKTITDLQEMEDDLRSAFELWTMANDAGEEDIQVEAEVRMFI